MTMWIIAAVLYLLLGLFLVRWAIRSGKEETETWDEHWATWETGTLPLTIITGAIGWPLVLVVFAYLLIYEYFKNKRGPLKFFIEGFDRGGKK